MFELPKLSYSYDALEPVIDAKTMEIHHSKHFQAYINKLNENLDANGLTDASINSIFENASKYPPVIINNGGGYYNHYLYFETLTPGGSNEPKGELLSAIEKSFGSFDNFKEEIKKASLGQFGSGWAWLLVDENKELKISSTANQNNPLMDFEKIKGYPILGIDVWEHAYYLKHQNMRANYVEDFLKVVNYDVVEKEYLYAMGK